MAEKPEVVVKKKRGRPRVLSNAERDRRNKAYRTRFRQTTVSLTSAYERWQALKSASRWTHFELADHLMEMHEMFCKCSGILNLAEKQRTQSGERQEGVHTSKLQEESPAKGITMISTITIADAYTQTEETSFEPVVEKTGRGKRKGSHKGRSKKKCSAEEESSESAGLG